MSLSLVIVAFVVLLTSGGGVQAVFTPADSAALNAAVQGCLGETADGSCPIFAASNDGTAGNPNGVMGDWNVSRVTSLKETFYWASAFNADISKWVTARVTTMEWTFKYAAAFNADISKWDTGLVTTMYETFYQAGAFNADISKWITARVTSMWRTFRQAAAFNADISNWDTGLVTTMYETFQSAAAFNADISKWDTGQVTSLYNTFTGAVAFNADISKWVTARVTTMYATFYNAQAFNADISKWDTGQVTTMDSTFTGAVAFNADISKWATGQVTTMDSMFWMSGFKRTLCGGEWQSLSSDSGLTSGITGRLGCCPAGSFMSNPMLNPFSVANSCQQCPAGTGPVSSNDETQWIDECPADAVTPSSAAGATTHEKASNSKSIHTVMIGIMIAFVSVLFSNAW